MGSLFAFVVAIAGCYEVPNTNIYQEGYDTPFQPSPTFPVYEPEYQANASYPIGDGQFTSTSQEEAERLNRLLQQKQGG